MMRAQIFHGLDTLPDHFLTLLQQVSGDCYFRSLAWYQNLAENASESDSDIRLYGIETQEPSPRALALFPAQVSRKKPTFFAPRLLEELSNFYSLEAGPVLSPTLSDIPAVLDCLVAAISEDRPRWDAIRFGPIDKLSPVFEHLPQILKRHRLAVETYFHHGNRFEDVTDLSFEKYIANLGKNAKEAVRKSRKLDREHDVHWSLAATPAELAKDLEAYETVYSKSWKAAERYPLFIPNLMEHTASIGQLRLANLFVDGKPVATQLIVLSGKKAVMFKTAHVSEFSNYSIGTVVMVHLLRHILANDQIERIDLGAGDEPYKAHWASQRQERWGVLAYNYGTAGGLAKALAMHGREVTKPLCDRARSLFSRAGSPS